MIYTLPFVCHTTVSVRRWAQVKNIMRVNSGTSDTHFSRDPSADGPIERRKKKKKQMKYRSNGVECTDTDDDNLSRVVLGSTLFSLLLPSFLFLFLFFFVACSLDTFVDRKGCSIFSYHFEGIGRGRCDEFVN